MSTEKWKALEAKLGQATKVQDQVKLLNDLAWALRSSDPKRGAKVAQQAFDLVSKSQMDGTDAPLAQSESLYILGYLALKKEQFGSAILYFSQALTLAEVQHLSEQVGKIHQALAQTYKAAGDFETALTHLEASQKLNSVDQIQTAQAKIDQLQAALKQQTQQLTKLQEFARVLAHDMKSPLNIVAGYASLLLEDISDQDETDIGEFAYKIEKTVHRMRYIIEEVALLAMFDGPDPFIEALNMREIIDEVQERLKHVIQESEVDLIRPNSWPLAQGNSAWVQEIWACYIGNAIKHGRNPKRVVLGATEQADGLVRFWVQDNGRGLAKAKAADPFKPGHKRKSLAKGYGLGLPYVRLMVERQGGSVAAQPVEPPGQGTIFSFTLPKP